MADNGEVRETTAARRGGVRREAAGASQFMCLLDPEPDD